MSDIFIKFKPHRQPYVLWTDLKAKRGEWDQHSEIFKWTPPLDHDSWSAQFEYYPCGPWYVGAIPRIETGKIRVVSITYLTL